MSSPPPTTRLTFREWTPADLEVFQAICSDPAVMQFVGEGEPWTRERTQQWIEQSIATCQSAGYCLWPLIEKETTSLIGFCGFRPGADGAEIGWRLAQRCWGRGLASEAARSALRFGFEALGFNRVFAHVQAPNQASIRVCEKLGLVLESNFDRSGRRVLVYATDGEGF